jgi:hypothetical protein
MSAVYGLYPTPEAAQRAFDNLLAAGLKENEVTVMSSEPLEEYGFAARDRQTVMPWIAVVGAVIGLSGAYLLTSLTQQAWPIDTGGMPIVSNWTNIIIMFELTMLGAVFATVLTLLKTASLPSRRPKFYDPEISQGKILVGVGTVNATAAAAIESALRAANPDALKTK